VASSREQMVCPIKFRTRQVNFSPNKELIVRLALHLINNSRPFNSTKIISVVNNLVQPTNNNKTLIIINNIIYNNSNYSNKGLDQRPLQFIKLRSSNQKPSMISSQIYLILTCRATLRLHR
jgi:hypothetical protein